MKYHHTVRQPSLVRKTSIAGVVVASVSLVFLPITALAAPTSANSTQSQARVLLVIVKGNTEIARRLSVLTTLSTKITSSTKLSASDQQILSSEVSNEITGLTSLKTKLDSDTTVTTVVPDAESIFTNYRVFALVVPQVNIVKTADQQQQTETKLTALATKIQADINSDQAASHEITNLQTELSAMSVKVAAAQTISSGIETGVISLLPSDYNTNHAVLSGDRDQLKTAQGDNAGAIADAKVLVSSLKSLK
jgi:hypothetical protein